MRARICIKCLKKRKEEKINPRKVSLEKKGRTQENRGIKLAEDILRSRRYRRNGEAREFSGTA